MGQARRTWPRRHLKVTAYFDSFINTSQMKIVFFLKLFAMAFVYIYHREMNLTSLMSCRGRKKIILDLTTENN